MESTIHGGRLWSDIGCVSKHRPTVGLLCRRERLSSPGATSLKRETFQLRSVGIRILASADVPPPSKRDKFSAKKLFEEVRVRLGLNKRKNAASLPAAEGDVDLEKELASLGVLDEKTVATLKTREDEETATSVTRDDMNPTVLWEQGENDIEAERLKKPTMTSPGFSFSAAGHLFPYHLGACQCLIENGFLTDNTPLAGSSAGALVCAVVAGGLSMSEALKAAKEVAQDCRAHGTAFRVGAVLRGIMEKYLPEDAHTRVSGRIRIAVTQVFRKPRGLLVDTFDSREDLINALHTSCFIPGYFAPRPVTIFRNRVCIDGGFTQFMPPTAAEMTVRICALLPSAYKIEGVDISPDVNPSESRRSNQELLSLALTPAKDEVLDDMFRVGYEDALFWVKQQSDASKL